jgi:class 3 adenylate cyclase
MSASAPVRASVARSHPLQLEPVANKFRTKATPQVESVSLCVVSHAGRHQEACVGPPRVAPVFRVTTIRATVLFADMRGYTGLAETLPPARVLPLLNEIFGVLARVTQAYGGEVFYMAGDGMMAAFGVRDPTQQGAREALAAGRTMQRRFSAFATRWQRDRSVVIGIGIGLHLGEVALGLLGPPGKGTVTLVGDTTNVAARLCSRARHGEVLFSSTVAAALDADHGPTIGTDAFLLSPQFSLRGRRGLIDIWCLPPAVRKSLADTGIVAPHDPRDRFTLQAERDFRASALSRKRITRSIEAESSMARYRHWMSNCRALHTRNTALPGRCTAYHGAPETSYAASSANDHLNTTAATVLLRNNPTKS